MSLTPQYWGKPVWDTMYIMAYTFPEEPTQSHRNFVADFYEILANILPCNDCKQHYRTFLDTHSIDTATESRMLLLKWVNDLHNAVNRQIKSPPVSLNTKINEMDNHNPDLLDEPETTATTSTQRFSVPIVQNAPITPFVFQPPQQQPQPQPQPVVQRPPPRRQGGGLSIRKAPQKRQQEAPAVPQPFVQSFQQTTLIDQPNIIPVRMGGMTPFVPQQQYPPQPPPPQTASRPTARASYGIKKSNNAPRANTGTCSCAKPGAPSKSLF